MAVCCVSRSRSERIPGFRVEAVELGPGVLSSYDKTLFQPAPERTEAAQLRKGRLFSGRRGLHTGPRGESAVFPSK